MPLRFYRPITPGRRGASVIDFRKELTKGAPEKALLERAVQPMRDGICELKGAIGNVAGQPGMGINGGLTQREGPAPEIGAPVTGCNVVVGVDDVDGLMRRGIELGGTEALPATDWPGIGRGGYLLDPDHNVFGLLSPVLSDGTTAMGPDAEAV